MKQKSADGFFLKGEELLVLLLLSGVEKLYGFQIPAMEHFTEREAEQAIFTLGQKGFAVEEAGQIKLNDKVKAFVELMVSADSAVYAQKNGLKMESLCLYLNSAEKEKPVVCMEIIGEEGKILRISFYENVLTCIEEKGFLLEEIFADDMLYQENEWKEDIDLKNMKWQTSLEVSNVRTGELQKRLLFFKCPIKDFLLEEAGEKKTIYVYSRRMLKKRLYEEAERDEI